MKKLAKNTIVRYLKGDINQQGREELIEWINHSEENRKYFEEISETWYVAAIINIETFNAKKARHKVWLHTRGIKHFLNSFFKYAALIIVFSGLGWSGHLLYSSLKKEEAGSFMELSVYKGETAHFQFSDGTKIQLNAESSIRFPENFQNDRREVFLHGEAYFQVNENTEWPFVIHSADLDIRVTGTSFNVRAYPDEDIIETTLVDGKVQVYRENNTEDIRQGHLMKAGQQLRYHKEAGEFQLNEVDPNLYTSWKDGYYKFSGIQLNRLIKSLERLYDVKIRIENPELGNLTYSGSFFKEESIYEVLEMIEKTSFEIQINQLENKTFLIVHKKK